MCVKGCSHSVAVEWASGKEVLEPKLNLWRSTVGQPDNVLTRNEEGAECSEHYRL